METKEQILEKLSAVERDIQSGIITTMDDYNARMDAIDNLDDEEVAAERARLAGVFMRSVPPHELASIVPPAMPERISNPGISKSTPPPAPENAVNE